MNLRPDIVRCTIFFAPYKSGAYNSESNPLASSDTVKPAADNAAWLKLGDDISDTSIDPSSTESFETFIVVAGQRYLKKERTGTKRLNISFTTDALSKLIYEAVLGADITVNTDFAPLGGKVHREGWLKIQGYGSSDENLYVGDFWVALSHSGALTFVPDVTKPKLACKVLYSTLNSVKLPTASGY